MKVLVEGKEAFVSDDPFNDPTPALFTEGVPVPRKYTCARCGLHKTSPVYRFVVPGQANGLICASCRSKLVAPPEKLTPASPARRRRKRIGVRAVAAILIVALLAIGAGMAFFNSGTSPTPNRSTSRTTASGPAMPYFSVSPSVGVQDSTNTPGSCTFTRSTVDCTGTLVKPGESFFVTATVLNPGSLAQHVSFNATATKGFLVDPDVGTLNLSPGQNSITWTVTAGASTNLTADFTATLAPG